MRRCMLQRVDVLHQGTYGFQALGLAELDVEALFDVADKLRHVQRVDAQLVERSGSMSRFSFRISFRESMVATGVSFL